MPDRPASAPRILHLHFGKEGGAERFFVSLCKAFADRGVEQRFLIRPGRSWRPALAAIGKVTEAHYPRIWPFGALLRAWVNWQVRRWKPDAVIAWMPRAASLLPQKPGPARLVRLGDYPRHIAHFRHADCIVTNTPDVPRRLTELGWTGPVRVISNFPRAGETGGETPEIKLPKDAFLLVSAGRFVKLKGFDNLIRAMAAVPGTALCLVGGGDEQASYEAIARELGVTDRLMLTGWVAEPMRWLAAADLICVPSTHETLGNVVLEAWSCGKPVISTPTPGPSWLIDDGINGFLVPDFSVEALAAGIRRVMADPDLARRTVEGGRQKLDANHSTDAIVGAYLDAINAYRRH